MLYCSRKSHIPDGPGYQEKWYFTPGGHWSDGKGCYALSKSPSIAIPMRLKHTLSTGDTGFVVSKTKYATIGELLVRAAGPQTLTNLAAETSKKGMVQFASECPC